VAVPKRQEGETMSIKAILWGTLFSSTLWLLILVPTVHFPFALAKLF
jgi:hypothetical protein